MATHRGKVKEYIVGQGRGIQVEITGLPAEDYQDRFLLRNDDRDRKYIHDCILVALANNLDIKVAYNDQSRHILYVRIYPS
jgi:hypothetical protein